MEGLRPAKLAKYIRVSLFADGGKQEALRTINALAYICNTVIWSNEESESDATEVMLQNSTADAYMGKLLVEWRMNWQKVLKLGTCRPSHSRQRKADRGFSSRGKNKKSRGGRKKESE